MRVLLLKFIMLFVAQSILAQIPNTDIYILEFDRKRDGKIKLGKPLNFTPNKGYDNQATFSFKSDKIFYTSIPEGEEKSDIYLYDIASQETIQLTATDSTSEYSPVPMMDRIHFSVVRVEEDDSTQRMWQFPLPGVEEAPQLLLENTAPVGYYTWYNEQDLAMFVLGEPMNLQLATAGDTSSFWAAGHIGRCIQAVPGTSNTISFVHKLSEENWLIKEINSKDLNTETITATLPGSEDYCWTPEGEILMGNNGKLYLWSAASGTSSAIIWREIADFNETPLQDFYRIAMSPDGKYITLVVNVKEEEK